MQTKSEFCHSVRSNHHEISDRYLITTNSPTVKKKQQLEEISAKFAAGVKGGSGLKQNRLRLICKMILDTLHNSAQYEIILNNTVCW